MVLRPAPGGLSTGAQMGAGAPTLDVDRDHSYSLPEHLLVQSRAQGFLPAAGYGTAQWLGSGGTRHFIPGHERQDATVRENHAEGSGGRYGGRVRGRRLGDQSGPVLRHAEATRAARPMQDSTLLEPLLLKCRRCDQSIAG